MSSKHIRNVAIDHHHEMAGVFRDRYSDLAKDRFASAFTYGRSKVDRTVGALFASLPRGGSILDVGCGTGEHLKRALDLGLQATGVEPADGMRRIAETNALGADVRKGDATKLPFDDNQFDAVIMIEVLRYLHRADAKLALKEARRVLKPEGKILVTLVNRWSLDGFYLFHRARQLLSFDAYNVKHPYCLFFTPASARRLFRSVRFRHVRSSGLVFGPIRTAYKLGFGAALARKLERADDRLSPRMTALAGHLVVTAQK